MIGRTGEVGPLVQDLLFLLHHPIHELHRVGPERQPGRKHFPLAPSRPRQRLDDQLGAFDRIAGLPAIGFVEHFATRVQDRSEVVDDISGHGAMPAAEEVGAEVAGLDADDLDAQMADLLPQALGHERERGFGGAVVPESHPAVPPAEGAHVGNHAGSARTHVRQDCAGDGERAEDVGAVLRFDLSVTGFVER